MRAGPFTWYGRSPGLYRDIGHAKVAGVCAGLGAYFQVRTTFIRVAMILAAVFGFFAPIAVIYVLLAILLPPMPTGEQPAEGWHARDGAAAPSPETLRERFRQLDQRLGQLEARVTSEEFQLRQKFRDL